MSRVSRAWGLVSIRLAVGLRRDTPDPKGASQAVHLFRAGEFKESLFQVSMGPGDGVLDVGRSVSGNDLPFVDD